MKSKFKPTVKRTLGFVGILVFTLGSMFFFGYVLYIVRLL